MRSALASPLVFALLIASILKGRCSHLQMSFKPTADAAADAEGPIATTSDDAIPVGGWGDWTYVYEPSYLPVPTEADVEHAHGIVIQEDGTLVITYQDKTDDSKCLLRWKSSGYKDVPEFLGPGQSLCAGVPHGLRADFEKEEETGEEKMVLYHANNAKHLHKTTIDGDLLWSVEGNPAKEGAYSPTWFAAHPDSPYVYMADGYGASKVC